MYFDAVVIAGIVTVLLMLGFFGGVAVFIMKDSKNHREGGKGAAPSGQGKRPA